MSEIDWSKAPEGATHAGFDWKGKLLYFYRIPGVQLDYDYWDTRLESSKWVCGTGVPAMQKLIPRPSAWSGDGLPPVGTVCEDDAGNEVVIVAHHVNGVHAIFAESLEDGLLYYGAAGEFRPIRTPEQIAAEEREKAIDSMVKVWSRTMGRFAHEERGLAEMLYDNGYRKVEP